MPAAALIIAKGRTDFLTATARPSPKAPAQRRKAPKRAGGSCWTWSGTERVVKGTFSVTCVHLSALCAPCAARHSSLS